MGMSASQARFLGLTARKSNVEYQAQQINFERLRIAEQMTQASTAYNDKISNHKMVYSFNNGEGLQTVDVTYQNYKNYMNQQLEGITNSHNKMYLVSSSGNKIVVASKEERDAMIEAGKTRYDVSVIESAKAQYAAAEKAGTLDDLDSGTKEWATKDLSSYAYEKGTDQDGNERIYLVESEFSEKDFIVAEDLDSVDNFQSAIQNGVYYFATRVKNPDSGEYEFKTQDWNTIEGGAVSEAYDKADDAEAEAEYDKTQDRLELIDKKLELQLDKLNTERDAIETEMESVKKVIEDNVESTFKVFS